MADNVQTYKIFECSRHGSSDFLYTSVMMRIAQTLLMIILFQPVPPGCPPNAAQIAAANGGTVHMSQQKAGVFTSPSDGGVSTHID